MSEVNNEPQAVAPQATVMSANAEAVYISQMMGAGAEFKSLGNKSGNGQALIASGDAEQR